MSLENIRIILVGTTHPGNIGSSARAMKTMGLSSLYLVHPKRFPDQAAIDMAAGADDILASAQVVSSLEEALTGTTLVIGTSARPRGIGLLPLTPKETAKQISTRYSHEKIAIVFGREHAGLTNDELLMCHYHMNIPSSAEYSSLNLAMAVQIITYELRMHILNPKPLTELRHAPLAKAEDVARFFDHLEAVLVQVDFLKQHNPKRLLPRLRRLFNRIQLEQMEVNILRGMLKHISHRLNQLTHKDEA